jgi:drug/metabolite transporter (DMT)-like permease
MSVPAAYLSVIVIWATTPLAIKWSSGGVSFYDAVLLRMLIAAPVACGLLAALRVPLPWHSAWRSYAAGAFSIYGGLLPTYYAAQYIPSGLISVLYGLAPIVSSLMAARWLDERALTPTRLLALLVAVGGLLLVFRSELALGPGSSRGLVATLAGVVLFTAGSVLVKRHALQLHPLAQTSGTLLLATPLFALTWWCKDGSVPDGINGQAVLSTAYLAVVGSVLSYVMYFYILRRLPLSRVALTTLVSPVLALLLGVALAGEQLPSSALAGCLLILTALAVYQVEERVVRWLTRQG